MQFHSLYIKNLFSFIKAFVHLSNTGLVLVAGKSVDEGCSNGAGKSSLINKSLLWALFGQTANGSKSDSVVNIRATGDPIVASAYLHFFIGDDVYRIERERKYKQSSKLTVYKNSECISDRDVRSTQEMINSIIGRNLESFIQTDFFGQGNNTPFMKLTPLAQKTVIEKILPFESLDEWLNNAKEAKKTLLDTKNKFETIKQATMGSIEALENNKVSVRTQSDSWNLQRINTVTALNLLLDNLKNSNENKEIEKINAEIQALKTSTPDIGSINQNILTKTEEAYSNSNFISKYESQILDLERKLESANKKMSSSVCPSCLQTIQLSDEEKLELQKQIQVFNVERINTTELVTALRQISQELESGINRDKSIQKQYQDSIKRLAELQKNQPSTSELENRITDLVNAENPHITTLAQVIKDINLYAIKKLWYDNQLKLLLKEEEAVLLWEKAFSKDFKLMLYTNICPFLTERTNLHLQNLNNSQLQVSFLTTAVLKNESIKNELSVTASSITGGDSYDLLSGGEQQIVDFAVGLALSDLATLQSKSKSNILILDEPFVGLDSKNSESIVNYLQEVISKEKDSIFIISNEDVLKGLIPTTINVEKHNGISTIVT